MQLDEFRRQSIDKSGHAAIQLAIADRMQVKPIPHARIIGLYLATKTRESSGEREQTQWALTTDQARWLIDNLESAIRDLS